MRSRCTRAGRGHAARRRHHSCRREIPTAETQLKLIDALAAAPGDGDDGPLSGSGSLPAILAAMSSGASGVREKIRAARINLCGLEAQIAATKAELEKRYPSDRLLASAEGN
jgi:hypothetical protein